ncbi:hypothetical protein C1H46_007553 [Malus baccata]|uniref:PHD-type domain-containing protein n=1 Tax=Malus baccata TaxID=106549 RepID=A0A540N714_MALBA|nr:hypothetical protein C1H46_007553 [Malus baccata]
MGVEEGNSNDDSMECDKEVECLKSESNGFGNCNDIAKGSSGASEGVRTYKRRRQARFHWDSRSQDDGGADVESSSQLVDQRLKEPVRTDIHNNSCDQVHVRMNSSDACSDRHWTTSVLENMYQSLGDDEGGVQVCIREAIAHFREVDHTTQVKESGHHNEDRHRYCFLTRSILNRSQNAASRHAGVWIKLQVIGTDLISLAKNLSDMSRASYNEQFYPLGSDFHTKVKQTEDCCVHSVCTCRCCGCCTNGKDCLVCDSCEEMYHISCIEPAVKQIPPSWYCARCTASGLGSSHENCVVCKKLNVAKTLVDGVGGESVSTDEETVNETGQNSKLSADDGTQLLEESKEICKTCGLVVKNGERLRICGHPYCPKKYYHMRCLTTNQSRLYGPRWYCYSCLCRSCLTDKDDDMIVLCDGCDHAYHLYCMEPPRTSIPVGKWFCRKCDAGIKAMRKARNAYDKKEKTEREKDEGSKKEKCDDRESERGRGGMEVLLCAVNTLDNEEVMKSKKE